MLGAYFPTYAVRPETAWWGLLITAGIGLLAGIVPALTASRLKPVNALRSEG